MTAFDENSLLALADSIRERGVLQPIIVRSRKPEGYELIAAASAGGEPPG